MWPDFYNRKILRKRFTCWTFCFSVTEDTAVINPSDNVLKISQLVVTGNNPRIITVTFGVNLSGYNIN